MKEEAIKFYSKHKLLVFPAVVAISSLILIVFVILPQTLRLITNQSTSEDLLNKSRVLEAKAAELDSLDEQDLSKKVQYALGVYPADKDFGNVMGILQTITSQAGFSIISLNLGDQSTQSYKITLQITGPKTLLPLLLASLEEAPRLIRVDNLEISSASVGRGVEAKLNLNILYSPAPASFGSVDSPLPILSEEDEGLLATLAGNRALPEKVVEEVSTPRGKANPFE